MKANRILASNTRHARALLLACCAILPATCLAIAEAPPEKAAEVQSLADHIEQQSRAIDAARNFCLRLLQLLEENGFSSDDLANPVKPDSPQATGQVINIRLADAIAAVSRVAAARIMVNWKALNDAGIEQDSVISFKNPHSSARAAIEAIIAAAGGDSTKLVLMSDDENWTVTTAEEASGHVKTRIYDVSAFLPHATNAEEATESLGRLVVDSVAPDSWRDAGGIWGTIEFAGGKMRITQTPENLKGVESLLEQLDVDKQITHYRTEIDDQDRQLSAIKIETEKLIARCRSIGIRVPLPLEKAMTQILPDCQFIGLSASRCLQNLQDLSGQRIQVNREALTKAGTDLHRPIVLSLHRSTFSAALDALTEAISGGDAHVAYRAENGGILISTSEALKKASVITRVYDIRELLRGGSLTRQEQVDRLIRFITDTVDTDSWRDNGGTMGALRELSGQLIVTQSAPAQTRIKALIAQLLPRARLELSRDR